MTENTKVPIEIKIQEAGVFLGPLHSQLEQDIDSDCLPAALRMSRFVNCAYVLGMQDMIEYLNSDSETPAAFAADIILRALHCFTEEELEKIRNLLTVGPVKRFNEAEIRELAIQIASAQVNPDWRPPKRDAKYG